MVSLLKGIARLAVDVVEGIYDFVKPIFRKEPDRSNDTMRQIEYYHANRGVLPQRRGRVLPQGRRVGGSRSGYQRASSASDVQIREAGEREAAAREREQAANSAAADARARAEAAVAKAEEATRALEQGIRPIQMPTKAQVDAAMKRTQYNPEKLHFAVCGTSGSGKSSLINAFRGLGQTEADSAAVGVTETTSQVTRYPDPRSEPPFSRFVWYDIPGAGTMAVSDWQYFNDQGLFVFDFIVMVYDVRFTKIDVGIIENCYRFNIPVFIVRSKADQHIDNMMKDADIDSLPGDPDYEKIYEEIKLKYVQATKSDFNKHIKKMSESQELDERDRQMILTQRVYLVDAVNVRRLLRSGGNSRRPAQRSKVIHEELLVEDMLEAAVRRRYPSVETKGLFRSGRRAT